MKLNINTDKISADVIHRTAAILGFEISSEGINVNAVFGERNGVSLADGTGTIYYSKPNMFFRELGVFVENAKIKDEFDISEDSFFKTVGAMIDCSRGAVPKVETVFKMIDYLAIMGYNMLMLYTEDTIELKNRPYLGYLRGRYTEEELRAIDDYAFCYGIEVIPCIECYGHMEKYLVWPEASAIKDTERVLLAREEKTFEFLEELISHTSGVFRSRRIHIGMDEAWNMGRGRFLSKNGYVPPIDIFNEFMERLIQITNKHKLVPMMWSDMYFRTNSPNDSYYDKETEIDEATKAVIPQEVQLVFWHYGDKYHCDDYMLKKHTELNNDVIFAGGLWSWTGHFPEHNLAFEGTKYSLEACRNNNVREMISTVWLNDGAECEIFTNLYGLSFSAELCFNKDATDSELRKRFESCTGGNAEAFYNMCMYNNKFGESIKYEVVHDRFFGKLIFWQDIMAGLFDTHLYGQDMSLHYRNFAEQMKRVKEEKWKYMYDFAAHVFEFLSLKCEFAEKSVSAYKSDDKETLNYLCNSLLPRILEKLMQVHNEHRQIWFNENKAFGWNNLDLRYGGLMARCETARKIIGDYLDGKTDVIEEFEAERLHKWLGAWAYKDIAYL